VKSLYSSDYCSSFSSDRNVTRSEKFGRILVSRMTRVLLPMLSVVSVFASALSGEQPLHVTVQQLLARPEKFAGKRVDVIGYCQTMRWLERPNGISVEYSNGSSD
jgi:predicted DNA repair protein MutK